MFGLFRGPLGTLERRMFSFTSEDVARRSMSSEMMEVKVYRSKGRRRIEPVVEECKAGVDDSGKARQLGGAGIKYGYLLLTYLTHLPLHTSQNSIWTKARRDC